MKEKGNKILVTGWMLMPYTEKKKKKGNRNICWEKMNSVSKML